MLIRLLPGVRAARALCRRLQGGGASLRPEPYLSELLSFAKENNPYYASLPGELKDLPPLTKALMRENFERLQSLGAGPVRRNSSGGSTGLPLTVLQDEEYSLWNKATEAYYYAELLGVDALTAPKVVLWGSERDKPDLKGRLVHRLTRTVFINAFKAGPDDWERSIETINRTRPVFVKGYAGSLYQLARLAKERDLRLYTPRFVYSSAELLREWMRREIEDAFGCEVRDFYGSREVGPIAGECKAGRKHVFAFNNLVECVEGRLLVTNLHNKAMPLLRYDIGDAGALGQGPCSCGSTLPWLARLEGRVTDHFVKRDRTLVHGEYFTHLFYFRDWVRQFQVSQRDYEEVEIAVVADPGLAAAKDDMREIEDKIRRVMGGRCGITWSFVPSIPATPQGKHLFTRCLIEG